MNKNQVNKLTDKVKGIVRTIARQNQNVIAAYSDGSFARDDMVRGSDVDIGFVVNNGHGEGKIYRRIIDKTVFEWGFFEKHYYADIDAILGNAGFTHNIVSAKIWLDPNDYLKDLQNTIRQRYLKPESIRTRAENQVRGVENNLREFNKIVEGNDSLRILATLLSIIRHLFAVPSAVLNKPLTNSRAYLYCKRDSQELGFNTYPDLILKILGSFNFTDEKAKKLLGLAYKLYDESALSKEEIETYKAHLEIVDYMMEINEPQGAMWPLFFWMVGPLNKGEFEKEKLRQNLSKSLSSLRRELKLLELENVKTRFDLIAQAIKVGRQMIRERLSSI